MYNSNKREILKGQRRPAGGWVHGPAHLEFFKLGWDRLVKVAHLRDATLTVTHVRAARVKGSKKIYIWPVLPTDPEAIPVTGPAGGKFINLIELLGPEFLMVETGMKERFALEIVDTSLGPVLTMDMANLLERRVDGKRGKGKKSSESAKSESAKPAAASPEASQASPAAAEAAAASQAGAVLLVVTLMRYRRRRILNPKIRNIPSVTTHRRDVRLFGPQVYSSGSRRAPAIP